MSIGIAGMGWVTPLGSGIAPVWERLLAGDSAVPETITSSFGTRDYLAFRVPNTAVADLPLHPRLRRSSAISRFAAAAGLAALKDAGLELTAALAERTAVIFAISNGGVIYTKRFYDDIVETGAQAASPLLFPETVFNAPASHLAAILGINGASYTLVGDGAVGLLAIKMAEDLMENDEALDRCLVVASEEADWLLCDAYRRWRLMRLAPPIEPFVDRPRGMILSEGAGAIVLGRDEPLQLERVASGGDFEQQRVARQRVDEVFTELCESGSADVVIASANGTFVDSAEEHAIQSHCPDAIVYTPKPALGEGVAAAGLWQIVCAAQALREQRLPAVLDAAAETKLHLAGGTRDTAHWRSAIVSVCGLNQQVGGLRLTRQS
jgi:3-oxoacyl-(acyl-carrier-protein) synthase